jgi:hypothetical protein
MEAEVLVKASHLHLITSPEQIAAALRNELYYNKKPVLIYKGASTVEAVRQIYKAFSLRKDMNNRPFQLSHAERGIMASDSWCEVTKLNPRDFRKYVEAFFSLVELTTYNGQPALVLAKELPLMMVPTFFQGRFCEPSMLEGFSWVD